MEVEVAASISVPVGLCVLVIARDHTANRGQKRERCHDGCRMQGHSRFQDKLEASLDE